MGHQARRWTAERLPPGRPHESSLTAARELVLPALYPHAARGLPAAADKGYTGARARTALPRVPRRGGGAGRRCLRAPPAGCRWWLTRATPAPAPASTPRSATTPTG